MKNLRKYGKPPFQTAVIHGGPGAPGEMAPVADELSDQLGILEPLQTKMSVEGQVKELKQVLEKNAAVPVVLIGFSWGAWLSYLVAARYPSYIKKLIMIGSPPFEESYAKNIMSTRLSRLDKQEIEEVLSLIEKLYDPLYRGKNHILERFGNLMFKADSFNTVSYPGNAIKYQPEAYRRVWVEAEKLRKDGALQEYGKKIQAPAVAIHGDYDPHPVDGVRKTLAPILKDFRFIELKNCGHYPWLEKDARDLFFMTLKKEINF